MENLNLLTVAVSSSALFDLSESDSIYQNEGLEAYRHYQIEREEQVLEPGEGFLLVKKLLSLNDKLGDSHVEVILLSRNSAEGGGPWIEPPLADKQDLHKMKIHMFPAWRQGGPWDFWILGGRRAWRSHVNSARF